MMPMLLRLPFKKGICPALWAVSIRMYNSQCLVLSPIVHKKPFLPFASLPGTAVLASDCTCTVLRTVLVPGMRTEYSGVLHQNVPFVQVAVRRLAVYSKVFH